jgi:hypothetical protein
MFLSGSHTDRGWRRGSLYIGGGEGFLVNGEKREGYRESAGEDFIPYMTIFAIGEGIGKLLKLLYEKIIEVQRSDFGRDLKR